MLFPFPLALFPFPFPSWAVWLFPFPWHSHGNGIPMGFPTPMHTSNTYRYRSRGWRWTTWRCKVSDSAFASTSRRWPSRLPGSSFPSWPCCSATSTGTTKAAWTRSEFYTIDAISSYFSVTSWLGGVAARTLDVRWRGRWFDSRSGRYQAVITRMSDCLRTGKPFRYLSHTQLALVLFSQLSAAVVHHKANDGVVDAIRAWFKYDTALSAVV